MKKYRLLDNDTILKEGRTLKRILYLVNIPEQNVKEGDLGGYLQSGKNLHQSGLAVVLDKACVMDDAFVHQNATVKGEALINEGAIIAGFAVVKDKANVGYYSHIRDKAVIEDNADITGTSKIYDEVVVSGNAYISGKSILRNRVQVRGDAKVFTNKASICDDVIIEGKAKITGFNKIKGKVYIREYAEIKGNVTIIGNVDIKGNSKIQDSAIVRATAEDSFIEITGTSLIEGHSLIIGKCHIDNSKVGGNTKVSDGYIENSVITQGAKVKESSLNYVHMFNQANVSFSKISGSRIIFKGNAIINNTTMNSVRDVTIRDDAKVIFIQFDNVSDCYIQDKALLEGAFQRVILSGGQYVFSDECQIRSIEDAGDLLFSGINISVGDHAIIEGAFIFNDNVTIEDFAVLRNEGQVSRLYKNTTINGDYTIELSA